jgi:type IX secretion system PorP/SprF family membrane protein
MYKTNSFKNILKGIAVTVQIMLGSTMAIGQQMPQFTEYNMNQYTLNPAVGGAQDYMEGKIGYRKQWVNFEDAPVTYYASFNTPIGKEWSQRNVSPSGQKKQIKGSYHRNRPFHAAGGYILNDVTGPTRRTWLYGSYGYHLPISKKVYASFGTFLGVKQFMMDGTQLTGAQEGDPLLGIRYRQTLPDAVLGTWIYSDNFYIGLSAHQLLGNKIKIGSLSDVEPQGKLTRHYFFTAGYNVPVADRIALVPSVMIRYTVAAPVSVDVNAKVRFDDVLWMGASYRHGSALAVLAGVCVRHKLDIGYAFDIGTNRITQMSKGTHEIVLGVRMGLKAKVVSPNRYWVPGRFW